jgi:hypothetical protein
MHVKVEGVLDEIVLRLQMLWREESAFRPDDWLQEPHKDFTVAGMTGAVK